MGVFDHSDRTVMAAGSQTPKHNRQADAGHHEGCADKTVETTQKGAWDVSLTGVHVVQSEPLLEIY